MAENTAVFEVKQYMIIWRQAETRQFGDVDVVLNAMVRCIGDEYTMDVLFVAEGSDYPEPQIDLANKKGFMFMPVARIRAFVDTLRNESPIFGHLRADKPEWTSITTTQEPVGEGETR
jgi:hypothetical protein